jgi:hypothetical protein
MILIKNTLLSRNVCYAKENIKGVRKERMLKLNKVIPFPAIYMEIILLLITNVLAKLKRRK